MTPTDSLSSANGSCHEKCCEDGFRILLRCDSRYTAGRPADSLALRRRNTDGERYVRNVDGLLVDVTEHGRLEEVVGCTSCLPAHLQRHSELSVRVVVAKRLIQPIQGSSAQ